MFLYFPFLGIFLSIVYALDMRNIQKTLSTIKTDAEEIKKRHIDLLSDIDILIEEIETKVEELEYIYQIKRKIDREKEFETKRYSHPQNTLLSDVSDDTEMSVPTEEYLMKYGIRQKKNQLL